ncbi:putative pyridoxal kinase [Ascosphaera aggregata]|nr:putative pyridoxal kinase [Ascosphaera aggregata]
MSCSDDCLVPETKVLAIASHVAYGFVGNTMATFVMQSLGCDVTAINTVNFSNHAGYRQLKGTRTSAEDVRALYAGICESGLDDFDVMLSGYAPTAEVVQAINDIAVDLRNKSEKAPGSFFWVLDPVMGDQGRMYVNDDVAPAYRRMIPLADLILPNQFEAEILSGIKISTYSDLARAIAIIHFKYHVPHIIITSVQLPYQPDETGSTQEDCLVIVGSTAKSDDTPRLFTITVPRIDCFFSGTGDMFAALTVARFRQAVFDAGESLRKKPSWVSDDDVAATELPLAKAMSKVLSSMHQVLEKTMTARTEELARYPAQEDDAQKYKDLSPEDRQAALAKRRHLRETKAAEVRLVRNVRCLTQPEILFEAQEWNH